MRWLALGLVLGMGAGLACGQVPSGLWEKTRHYARAWGLDPYLVAAVVWTESRYCTQAVGRAGEVGLGQFMLGTWARTAGAPLAWRSNPDWALWATAKHLRSLWERHRDLNRALMAYNAGAGAVDRGRVPASSVQYARKVLAVYRKWKSG